MELLVSVRSAAEACAALQGGAGLIDVKEPAHGSLGSAGADTIEAVVRVVAGRRPVSAALGEIADAAEPKTGVGLAYVKWGLSRLGESSGWPQALLRARRILAESAPNCRPVAVAYVDWERANAPSPQQVCAFACRQRWAVLLLDTWAKDGTTLLDWLSLTEVERLCQSCRRANIFIALAGSLGPKEVLALRPLRPNWFAVRGAVCRKRCRTGAIDPDAVRRMCDLVAQPITNAIVAN